MTQADLFQWAAAHVRMTSRLLYNDDSGYKREYQNGETYEYRTRRDDDYTKTTETLINGKTVNVARWEWYNFGWRLLEEAIS